MGWEKRRNESYYYRKRREGGKVRSEYVGRGDDAQSCVNERLDRNTEREALRSAREADEEIDQQLATAEAVLSTLANAMLYAEGYHKHKGQWRKRR